MGTQQDKLATLSKDELAQHMGETFGQARSYVERGDAIPKDIWFEVNQTVSALCGRVGIDTPSELVGFPSGS